MDCFNQIKKILFPFLKVDSSVSKLIESLIEKNEIKFSQSLGRDMSFRAWQKNFSAIALGTAHVKVTVYSIFMIKVDLRVRKLIEKMM